MPQLKCTANELTLLQNTGLTQVSQPSRLCSLLSCTISYSSSYFNSAWYYSPNSMAVQNRWTTTPGFKKDPHCHTMAFKLSTENQLCSELSSLRQHGTFYRGSASTKYAIIRSTHFIPAPAAISTCLKSTLCSTQVEKMASLSTQNSVLTSHGSLCDVNDIHLGLHLQLCR